MFGVADQGGTFRCLATVPELAWDLGLGIDATVWGFKASSPLLGREPAV